MGKKKKKHVDPPGIKTIAEQRRARFDFEIADTLEAGIELTGTEVKSLRDRKLSFSDSFANIRKGELYLVNLRIEPYSHGTYANHDPERTRKLLVKHVELKHLQRQIDEKGMTLVPLKLYFKKGWVKVLLGIAKGRKKEDKRQYIREREAKKEIARIKKIAR